MRYRMTMTMMHSNQFFFFNDTATTEIYPLPLHAALPISRRGRATGAGVPNSALPDLQAREPPHVDLLPRLGPQLDRKSTRLNSSHRQITYDAFCLKKKIILQPHRKNPQGTNQNLSDRIPT